MTSREAWLAAELKDYRLRAAWIRTTPDVQVYTAEEEKQLLAGLTMEAEVNRLRQTGASGLLSSSGLKAKETLKKIKASSPLLDDAVSMVSKDVHVVQSSALIRVPLMSAVAYMFCADQEVCQIRLEEDSLVVNRVVQRIADHALVLQSVLRFPPPLQDRESVCTCLFQKAEDNEDCIISLESSEHDDAPVQSNAVRIHLRRLFRYSPVSPTVTRMTVTTTMNLGGSIPRFVSDSVTIPAAARAPLSTLRYFNQAKPAESFEAADARELGLLLVLDLNDVRSKRDPGPLEAKLRTFVERSAALRSVQDAHPWFEALLVEALRNRLRVPKGCDKVLAEMTEGDARKAGRAFANALVVNVSAEAAVDEWVMTYPALGELEQRCVRARPSVCSH
ncbi:hypothetical protein TeGR_g8009 [Tetraparma gracilis]|uniref:Uncharacterized protein n=1 Tax=Tetraparma gracilis TaxID=2962635 RepID=A0ABQ6MMU9_9STRA|nr:hypothetical protein TeGR_g8009 [Tetraparma gracilis]